MEIVKCKKINIIVFLICVFILTLGGCAFGQTQRMVTKDSKSAKEIVTKYPSEGLFFESPLSSKEFIQLSAKSDSIGAGVITFNLYAYFPENINPKDAAIVIGYADGTNDVFQQSLFIKEENYAEYTPNMDIRNISTKKVSYVVFRGIAKCINKDKTYFTEFFKYL